MKRSVLALFALAIVGAALLGAGCGGGSGSGSSSTAPAGGGAPAGSKVVACKEGRMETSRLRATAVDCDTARQTMRRWESSHACTLGKGGSRSSCSLGTFRCQAVRVDGGAAVSCARPGADIAFIAKAWLLRKSGSG